MANSAPGAVGGALFGDAHWRNAHHVALRSRYSLVDAALVDPHFARAQDAVNMAFGDAFADAQQEVIDALAGFFFRDGDKLSLS